MARSRKGSIEMSISTVVVLILGIAFLGMGLLFIKNFMGKNKTNVEGIIDIAKLGIKPDASNKIVLKNNIEVKIDSTQSIQIGFYCDSSGGCEDAKPFFAEPSGNTLVVNKCKSTTTQVGYFTLSALNTDITYKKSAGYSAILKVGTESSGVKAGDYICNLKIAKDNAAGTGIANDPSTNLPITYGSTQLFISVI